MDAVEAEDRAKELLIATAEKMNIADQDSFYEMTWGHLFDVAVQALSLARSNGWQDIATLPRDGTAVLVIDTDGNFDFGYWHRDHVCSDGVGRSEKFTHWQPLPEPPLDRLR